MMLACKCTMWCQYPMAQNVMFEHSVRLVYLGRWRLYERDGLWKSIGYQCKSSLDE